MFMFDSQLIFCLCIACLSAIDDQVLVSSLKIARFIMQKMSRISSSASMNARANYPGRYAELTDIFDLRVTSDFQGDGASALDFRMRCFRYSTTVADEGAEKGRGWVPHFLHYSWNWEGRTKDMEMLSEFLIRKIT